MEKTLKELDKTWSEMEFENENHARTGLQLLKATEELIETLEDNQVTLLINAINCEPLMCIGSITKYDDFKVCWLFL